MTMRGGAAAARVTHNHEVAGSSPAPATSKLFEKFSQACRLRHLATNSIFITYAESK